MRASDSILCVGEVLWDAMPAGLFLGGAPLNVAIHLRRLGRESAIASRVGDDRLGTEAVRRLRAEGLPADLVQVDSDRPTGFVGVTVDENGSPTYDIVRPSAWDAIETTEHLEASARGARALVFGSLAQRDPRSRATIRALSGSARTAVFDVNLRPPFVDPEVVESSLRVADVVKLNEDELAQVAAWRGWPTGERDSVHALADAYGCSTVCVTRGERGAAVLREGEWFEHPGFKVSVVDTVGSGDAFLAALLDGILGGRPLGEVLDRACRLGAFVATRTGATPEYDVAGEEAFRWIGA